MKTKKLISVVYSHSVIKNKTTPIIVFILWTLNMKPVCSLLFLFAHHFLFCHVLLCLILLLHLIRTLHLNENWPLADLYGSQPDLCVYVRVRASRPTLTSPSVPAVNSRVWVPSRAMVEISALPWQRWNCLTFWPVSGSQQITEEAESLLTTWRGRGRISIKSVGSIIRQKRCGFLCCIFNDSGMTKLLLCFIMRRQHCRGKNATNASIKKAIKEWRRTMLAAYFT